MFPRLSFSACSAASPCARLSRAPSTTSGSNFHDGVCLPMDGPFSRHTRSVVPSDQDRRGSPRFRGASISVRAVLSDPAGVSSSLAFCGSLLVPSKFSTLSASGCSCNEAQSLHLRYGPDLALPTLSPCRYLHEPKARFQVGRLVPLAWAGISPAGSARFSLAHQRTFLSRGQPPSRSLRRYIAAPELPLDELTVGVQEMLCSKLQQQRRCGKCEPKVQGSVGKPFFGFSTDPSVSTTLFATKLALRC